MDGVCRPGRSGADDRSASPEKGDPPERAAPLRIPVPAEVRGYSHHPPDHRSYPELQKKRSVPDGHYREETDGRGTEKGREKPEPSLRYYPARYPQSDHDHPGISRTRKDAIRESREDGGYAEKTRIGHRDDPFPDRVHQRLSGSRYFRAPMAGDSYRPAAGTHSRQGYPGYPSPGDRDLRGPDAEKGLCQSAGQFAAPRRERYDPDSFLGSFA